MKRTFLSYLLIASSFSAFSLPKKHTIEGKAFYFGASYSKPVRAEFDTYMATISDSLKLTSPLQVKNNYGIHAGVIFRNGNAEFEAGGNYSFGATSTFSNANNSTSASLSTKTIDLHVGFSQYIAGLLFIGFNAGVINQDGKLTIKGGNAGLFEISPESHNPFKGYMFTITPKAGFYIPFEKNKLTGFKINAFYDISLSKYDFYNKDIFQNRLKNYNGAAKSSFKSPGLQLIFLADL